MIGSHANMVALANRLRVDDKNRGELESMRKDVFEGIYNGIRNLKKKQNERNREKSLPAVREKRFATRLHCV